MNDKYTNRFHKFLVGIAIAGMILAFYLGTSASFAARAQDAWTKLPVESGVTQEAAVVPFEASFTLDGVTVSVQASSLPSEDFAASAPGSAIQMATSVVWKPFREFSITVIPFGSQPPTEALPVAEPGGKPAYDGALRSIRLQQGGQVQDGPTISLFGQQITGLHSLVDLFIDSSVPKPVDIEEWVVEAGDRLWIIRSSREQSTGGVSMQSEIPLGDLVIDSSTLNNPSTIQAQSPQSSAMDLTQVGTAANLPTPSWWSGDCDINNYQNNKSYNPNKIASYRLGAVYLGVPACGPGTVAGGPDVPVHFFPGSWGELEWECVELSMRFLYQMYGIAPYSANGNQVVDNYSGNLLVKIYNDAASDAHQVPVPNDVLSYDTPSTVGHTSVVTASNVDGNGNGTITVMEENNTPTGSNTLTVSNWGLSASYGSVSGWLQSNTLPLNLFVTRAGTGSGTVTSIPTGINCGSTCLVTLAYNTAVTLTATPTYPYTFGGWSGEGCSGTGTCTVTMSSPQWVTATFNPPGNQTLSVSKAGTGRGTVTSSPTGINCGSTCSYNFAYNTAVTLTASPASAAYRFIGWSGGGCSGTGTCTVTMTAATSVTAAFTKVHDDFDGDGKTDPAKFVPAAGAVWYLKSSTATWEGKYLGPGTYAYVNGSDYDGDGKTDPAEFISANALWYLQSSTGTWQGVYMGPGSYTLVNGSDYDGDGKTDPALFISGLNALWYLKSSTGTWQGVYMGPGSYQMVAASDFDGDGKTDPALFVPGTNTLWYLGSSTGTWQGVYLGPGTYNYVAASDFDGDGKTDPAEFVSGANTLWYLPSSGGSWQGVYMGSGTFTYVAGCDFDGDGKTDPAKYDASTHTLSWLKSSTGTWSSVDMGTDTFTLAIGQ